MYAIVDVETTGGKFNEEGITEIAIYKFDGHEIVDQFSSLVNPEKEIQPFVVKLTGINNKMLIKAPKFHEVAKRIVEITNDTILVAHNAKFDYRMLRNEFDRLGYDFNRKTLCTVELSQKLLPEQPSHSLGKLTKALGIAIPNRHRAGGDALATVKLFKVLLEKDIDRSISQQLLKNIQRKKIKPSLKKMLDEIPSTIGIYYLYDKDQNLLHLGKSKNIKKTATQQFLKESRRSQQLQKSVTSIHYEKTGTELVALLKEYHVLISQKPKYNRYPRKRIFSYGLYLTLNEHGYYIISIDPIHESGRLITTFDSHKSGIKFLEKLSTTNHEIRNAIILDDHNNKESVKSLILSDINTSVNSYNDQILKALKPYDFNSRSCVILDRGRNAAERCAILIEHGTLKGYAFIDLKIQVTDLHMLQSLLVPLNDSMNTRHIVQSYLRRKKVEKIIDLDINTIDT